MRLSPVGLTAECMATVTLTLPPLSIRHWPGSVPGINSSCKSHKSHHTLSDGSVLRWIMEGLVQACVHTAGNGCNAGTMYCLPTRSRCVDTTALCTQAGTKAKRSCRRGQTCAGTKAALWPFCCTECNTNFIVHGCTLLAFGCMGCAKAAGIKLAIMILSLSHQGSQPPLCSCEWATTRPPAV